MLPGRLKVSVAIAALNEGPDLEAMLAMILAGKTVPDEIVLVDDGSLKPLANRLDSFRGVKVIRNAKREGSGPAKHRAVEACTGDVVIVLDSHMRVPWDWLDLWLADHDERPGSVLCSVSQGFETGHAFYGMGANLSLEDGFWKPKWAEPRRDATKPYRVPCVIGGAYLIPRSVLSRIGGYAPVLRGYGVEEEYLSIRAYLVGADCAVSPRVIIQHHYGHNLSRVTATTKGEEPWEMRANRATAAEVCFEGRLYTDAALGGDATSIAKFNARIPAIVAASELLKTHTVRTKADMARLCGIIHPKD